MNFSTFFGILGCWLGWSVDSETSEALFEGIGPMLDWVLRTNRLFFPAYSFAVVGFASGLDALQRPSRAGARGRRPRRLPHRFGARQHGLDLQDSLRSGR